MLNLPAFSHRRNDSLVLGRAGPHGFSPKFRISSKDRGFHTYVVGLTGRGKSKFLQNCLVQDITSNRGCAAIDPHGDLAKAVLADLISKGFFSQSEVYDRIIYLAPRRRDYVVPMNVLARPDGETETYEIVQRVIASFMRTWSQTLQEPPRFQQIMRASLAVLVETRGTLCDLHRLLTDDDFRADQLAQIKDLNISAACRRFFENEYDKWGRDRAFMINSTTNKVTALTDNPSLFSMLGQKENRVNIRKAMDEGIVIIVDLGDCDDETKRLIGSLIVQGFVQAALSRARAPFETRRPYYLYVDEFQDFAAHPGQAQTFSQMLSQVRKFGLHLILANQSIAQLSQGLQTALGNAQNVVAFRISRADAEALSRVLGNVDTQAIKREGQAPTQHPVFAPLFEQWEDFIQFLTKQKVRQAAVKTADDRVTVIWSEKVDDPEVTIEELEQVITSCLERHGHPYENVCQNLSRQVTNVEGEQTTPDQILQWSF